MAETAAKTKTTMAEDLVALQAAIPTMPKNAVNPFFKSKYTPHDTIKENVQPIMAKYNFAWVTLPSFNEAGEATLKYQLLHTSGASIDGEMKIYPGKLDPQGQGAAITYARRYSLSSVLDIVSDEDDDGNAARRAAEAAKTLDPPAPEEPSVDVKADVKKPGLISAQTSKQLSAIARQKGFTGAQGVAFSRLTIGKDRPANEDEALELIASMEAADAVEPF